MMSFRFTNQVRAKMLIWRYEGTVLSDFNSLSFSSGTSASTSVFSRRASLLILDPLCSQRHLLAGSPRDLARENGISSVGFKGPSNSTRSSS